MILLHFELNSWTIRLYFFNSYSVLVFMMSLVPAWIIKSVKIDILVTLSQTAEISSKRPPGGWHAHTLPGGSCFYHRIHEAALWRLRHRWVSSHGPLLLLLPGSWICYKSWWIKITYYCFGEHHFSLEGKVLPPESQHAQVHSQQLGWRWRLQQVAKLRCWTWQNSEFFSEVNSQVDIFSEKGPK